MDSRQRQPTGGHYRLTTGGAQRQRDRVTHRRFIINDDGLNPRRGDDFVKVLRRGVGWKNDDAARDAIKVDQCECAGELPCRCQ